MPFFKKKLKNWFEIFNFLCYNSYENDNQIQRLVYFNKIKTRNEWLDA